jgi:GTP-binding protein YchF
MKVVLVGLAQSGKTTIFNSLTGMHSAGGRGHEVQMGNVKVPDARIDCLTRIFKPRKTTYADIDFLDVAGVRTEQTGSGFTQQVLAEMRSADAIVAVVADFDNPAIVHPLGRTDPLRDIKNIDAELSLTDLMQIEKRLDRIERERKKGLEKDTLVRAMEWLNEEKPLRLLELDDTAYKQLAGYNFLSRKPLLLLLNIGENKIGQPPDAAITEYVEENRHSLMQYCAEIELELSTLKPDEQAEFLADMGLQGSGKERFVRKVYEMLRLISFLTVGEDEVRAWSIPRGTLAVKAAGKIHSDIERGFIRAEGINFEEFARLGSMRAARDGGHLRLEGKDYEVCDGDIINFRFNV